MTMKRLSLLSVLLIAIIFAFLAFKAPEHNCVIQAGDGPELDFPEEVMAILERSCFDCHTAESSSTKAKAKLNFSKWNKLKDSKKVGKLDKICEEIKEGKMPTKKYLSHYPETKLSEKETALICVWVDAEVNKLLGD